MRRKERRCARRREWSQERAGLNDDDGSRMEVVAAVDELAGRRALRSKSRKREAQKKQKKKTDRRVREKRMGKRAKYNKSIEREKKVYGTRRADTQ